MDNSTLLYPDPEACAPTKHDLEQTICFLRHRLEQRNQIINIIRTAYHRDILNKEEGTDNHSSTIDLRPVIPLFAPHKGKLRRNACSLCGGGFEIKIIKEDKSNGLRSQLNELQATLSRLQIESQGVSIHLSEIVEKYHRDMATMTKTASCLVQDAMKSSHFQAKVEAMEQIIQLMQNKLQDHDRTKKHNSILTQRLAQLFFTTEEMYQLLYVKIHENQYTKDKYKTEILAAKTFESKMNEYKAQLSQSRNKHDDILFRLRTKEEELKSSENARINEGKLKGELEQRVQDLERTIFSMTQKHSKALSQMDLSQNELMEEARELREVYEKKCTEVEVTSKEIERLLDIEKLYKQNLASQDDNNDKLVTNLEREINNIVSIVDELFEEVKICNNHAETNLMGLAKLLNENGASITLISQKTNNKSRLIPTSIICTRESIQRFKHDQHKLINLLKRRHVDLETAIRNQFLRKDKEKTNEITELEETFEKNKLKLVKTFELKEQNLLRSLKDLEEESKRNHLIAMNVSKSNGALESEYKRIKEKYTNMRLQCDLNKRVISDLQGEILDLQTKVEQYKSDIIQTERDLDQTRQEMMSKQETIEHCKETIKDLQLTLAQTNCQYNSLVEKEMIRLQTNQDFGGQMKPLQSDASVEVDFQKPGSSCMKSISSINISSKYIKAERVSTASGSDPCEFGSFDLDHRASSLITFKELMMENSK